MRYSLLLAASAVAVSAYPSEACHVKKVAIPQENSATPVPLPEPLPVTNDPTCEDVHIFLARGWNEPYPGRQGALAGAICYGLPSCGYEDIQFWNPEGSDFCVAVSEGVRNGIAQLQAYAAKCPQSKLVLSGYSQGGYVVSNILGGGGGPFSGGCTVDSNAAISSTEGAGAQLEAILLFGEVQHTGGQSYSVLSGAPYSSNNPLSGERLANMNRFTGVLRSYCDAADPQCASTGPGPFDIAKHLDYFELYTQDAAGWAKSKLGF